MRWKRVSVFLFSLVLITLLCGSMAFAVVSPTKEGYVNDYGDVLSEETEQYIIQTAKELEQKTSSQIVVVTIPSLDGASIEEYATELFRSWGIGDKEKDNGSLLLVSIEDRKLRIEVGYGLEGDIPDGKAGRIRDQYLIPYLKEDQFDEGIRSGYTALLSTVADVYDVTIDGVSEETSKEIREIVEKDSEVSILKSITSGLGVAVFFCWYPAFILNPGKGKIRKIIYLIITLPTIYTSWMSNKNLVYTLIIIFIGFLPGLAMGGDWYGGGSFTGGDSWGDGDSWGGGGGSSGGGGASGDF